MNQLTLFGSPIPKLMSNFLNDFFQSNNKSKLTLEAYFASQISSQNAWSRRPSQKQLSFSHSLTSERKLKALITCLLTHLTWRILWWHHHQHGTKCEHQNSWKSWTIIKKLFVLPYYVQKTTKPVFKRIKWAIFFLQRKLSLQANYGCNPSVNLILRWN